MLIHVACPNCSEPYDIADTFAGGVYRCSKCNTLMSVPKKHTPPPATNLAPGMSRAASPDAIESRGSSQPSKASSSARSAVKAALKPAAKSAAKPPLKPGQKPPAAGLAAYKWHLVSLGGLVLVALLVFVIVKAVKGTKIEEVPKTRQSAPRARSDYDFDYKMGELTNAKPNVLGLPLTGNVAVILDGGSDLNGVRPALHKLLVAGLTAKGPLDKPSFTVVYANGETGAKVPVSPLAAVNAANGTKKLQDFLAKVNLKNPNRDDVAALTAALQRALDQVGPNQTRHVVLVVGRSLTPYAQNQLVSLMEDAATRNSTHFDLVVVDADASAMTRLTDQVAAARGKTAPVTATQLQIAANAVK